MEATVYTHHSADCPHQSNRYYRRCRCRKWLYLHDARKRITARTRSWEAAERLAREMSGDAPTAAPSGQTVKHAVDSFLEDKGQQALSANWERKLTRELKDFASWCDAKVVIRLADVHLQTLERYRATWTTAPITRRKRQERLRQFFLYCVRHKWLPDNPAEHLSTIKVTQSPTLPLTREQFKDVLQAAERYHTRGADREWRRQRATAMLLLLRWSGLRIGDAARLERTALSEHGVLTLHTQKTGEHVRLPLPPRVVKALRSLPNENPRFFFWNGNSAINSPGVRWWVTLKAIFKAAGIPDAHPHQLRDTFAVECLLRGVPIDQVSLLLGHRTVRTTERHYAPFVRARQQQLEASVRKAWDAS